MPWGREHIYIYASLDLGNSWHAYSTGGRASWRGYMFHVRFTDQYIVRDDGIKCSLPSVVERHSTVIDEIEWICFGSNNVSAVEIVVHHTTVTWTTFKKMYKTLYACRRSGIVLGFYDVVWIYFLSFFRCIWALRRAFYASILLTHSAFLDITNVCQFMTISFRPLVLSIPRKTESCIYRLWCHPYDFQEWWVILLWIYWKIATLDYQIRYIRALFTRIELYLAPFVIVDA
jgi:hypothetical protein